MKKTGIFLLTLILMIGTAVPVLAYSKDGWEYMSSIHDRDPENGDIHYSGNAPVLYDDVWLYEAVNRFDYTGENTEEDVVGYYIGGYLGEEETVKVPGVISGDTIDWIAMLMKSQVYEDGGCLDYGNGILERSNTTTSKIIFPCTVKHISSSEYAFCMTDVENNPLKTIVLPPNIEKLTPNMFGIWQGQVNNTDLEYPDLTIICEEGSATHEQLLKINEQAAAGKELKVEALPAGDPELMAIHNWDEGTTNAKGKLVYTCQDCGEVYEAQANKITAENKVASYKAKPQKIKLNASALGGSVLTYKSSSSKVKVSKTGVVTLPKKFSGKVTITITANDPSKIYNKATKKVTVTVPKAPSLKSVKSEKAKQLTVKWKKVSGVNGYQISYKTGSKTKTVKINKAATVSKVIKKLKSGKTYQVKVRSYIKSGKTLYYSNWSKIKKAKVK